MKKEKKESKWMIPLVIMLYLSFSFINITNNMLNKDTEMTKELTGSATGTVRINVSYTPPTECIGPSAPTLNPVSDTRDTSVTMSWTSHKTSTQFDQFVFDDSGSVTANSPQTKTRLSRTEHTWKVRTCDTGCCSAYASDIFRILTLHPAPVVAAVKEVINITPAKPAAPEVRAPSAVKITLRDIIQNLLRISYLMLTLIVSIILFVILWKKHDENDKKRKQKRLEEYVNNALKLGFDDNRIREKLAESGVTKEEINKIFDDIR